MKIAVAILATILAVISVYEAKQIRKLRNQTIESFKKICERIKR